MFITSVNAQKNTKELIEKAIDNSLNKHLELYKHLHANPELSFMELKTASLIKEKLEKIGFEVTPNFGGNGLVGVYKNGNGPAIMMRADMDALPILEKTELPFASTIKMKNDKGTEVSVMHACGHDMHMSVFIATADAMVKMKDNWKGTLLFVCQQAEERSGGAIAMINDGLFKKFLKPDYAFAYHVSSSLPAGTISYCPGATFASVSSVNVTFKGVGGHGAYPHMCIDPVVMASRAVVDFQTIVSREISPTDPAVVTVGSIHGGTQHNIIPDEVKLQLTIRAYKPEVRDHIIEAVERISKNIAISAGMPADKLPVIEVLPEGTPPVINNDELLKHSVSSFKTMLGNENVIEVPAAMVGEDFGRYGLTEENIPILLSWLGSVNPEKYEDAKNRGSELPALHSPYYYPDAEPTLKTGASAMVKAMMDLMNGDK